MCDFNEPFGNYVQFTFVSSIVLDSISIFCLGLFVRLKCPNVLHMGVQKGGTRRILGMLLNVLIILVFHSNKWLRDYQNDLKNVKHVTILTLLAVIFFSTFGGPRAISFKFDP